MTDEELRALDGQIQESNEWLAAQVRQLFRAMQAGDAKAIEVGLYYLRGYLVSALGFHLRRSGRWLPGERWLKCLNDEPTELRPPTWLRIQDALTSVTYPPEERWIEEPFEFEIELWPSTGALRHLELHEEAPEWS